MSSTLAHDKKSLRVFEAFEVDYQLPKWRHRMEEGAHMMIYNNITRNPEGKLVVGSDSFITPIGWPITTVSGSFQAGGMGDSGNKPGIIERIFGKSKRKKEAERIRMEQDMAQVPNMEIHKLPEEEPQPEMSVEEFFNSVKNSVEEIVLVREKIEGYDAAIKKLKQLGQVSLMQSMAFDIEMYRAEAQLYAIGMTKYLSEDNIIKFIKKSPKALRLDWIKNFVRIIPDDVAEKKIKADDRHIFDNYVVLHYDPDGKGSEQTVEEKIIETARKRDPILFGVVIGSRKLYYIGDWIDEYCDLTLEKVIEFLGEGAVKEITKETETE